MGNQLFNAAKDLVGITNGAHYLAASDALTSPLDNSINRAVQAIYSNIYAALLGLVLLIVAVLLFRRIWRGDFAAVTGRALWVLAALWTASSFLVIGPVYQQIDHQFFTRVDDLENGFLSAAPNRNSVDVLPQELHEQVVYRTWLRGEFGDDTSPLAKRAGPELLDAQAWTKTDQPTPATMAAKNAEYLQISGQLGSATGYFTGDQGSRIGDGFLAFIQALAYTLFLLASGLAILAAQVLLRLFILGSPLLGLVGLLNPHTLRRSAQAAAGVTFHLLILAGLAGINIFILHLLFTGTAPSTTGVISLTADITTPPHLPEGLPITTDTAVGGITELILGVAGHPTRRLWNSLVSHALPVARQAISTTRNALVNGPQAVRDIDGREDQTRLQAVAETDQVTNIIRPEAIEGGQPAPPSSEETADPAELLYLKFLQTSWTLSSGSALEKFAKLLDLDNKTLNPGKAAKSIQQIRNIRKVRERYRAAEECTRQRHDGGSERALSVPVNTDEDFPIGQPTTRRVDCPVDLPSGGTLAIEVKMYRQFRWVEVSPGRFVNQRVEVPLSNHIRSQINKDVALRNADPGYDPRWEFLGAGPSQALRDYLTKARIIFIEHL